MMPAPYKLIQPVQHQTSVPLQIGELNFLELYNLEVIRFHDAGLTVTPKSKRDIFYLDRTLGFDDWVARVKERP